MSLLVPALAAALPVADYTAPAARDTEAVILTGKEFPGWSAPSNVTAEAPLTDLPESGGCASGMNDCESHNNYEPADVDSGAAAGEGTPVDRLLAYRWDGARFVQIPFQVDEMFTRYLDNSASGFAFYSGRDQHTTYAFDREGFRFTEGECIAQAEGGQETTPDPVGGLDHNDELVFMAKDAGDPAPATAPLPKGIDEMRPVRIVDPTAEDPATVVYVAKAADGGPQPKFDATNGYVRYERDADADRFERSQSEYEDYGNAERGTICDAEGNVIATGERRRPRDTATVTTDRYRFRYDGRWLMTKVEISPDGGRTYGPDLVDRWKARAFQQDASSDTICCGYEEEDTNWGGSSTLLGERSGPVRTIRETWGADSGTNVIRRETFYRDEVRQKSYLRVHVIPPLDGIYAQWDFNAGAMTRFYNSAMTVHDPDAARDPAPGVPIDGKNDEVFGNLDDPCNDNYDENDTGDLSQTYRTLYSALPGLCSALLPDEACQPFDPARDAINGWLGELPQDPQVPRPCGAFPYHQSVDFPDPTQSEPNAGLQWNVTAGPHGTIVDRYQIDELTDQSAGGTAQTVFAVPYYRDDSCFDDGTGTNPGRKIHLRSADEPTTYTAPDGTTQPRECWDGQSEGLESDRYYQGSIGTHGLHILMIADSDNARTTVPVTEMVAEQRMVMLPGQRDIRAGEQYGRGFEKPLVATALPEERAANKPPTAAFDVAPAAPQTGRDVTLTSRSSDPDGGIEQLAWDLDADGEFDDGSASTATHRFPPGDHPVALRVTDTSGESTTAQRTVTVTNPAPRGSVSHSPANPLPGEPVTLTANATDENGSVAGYAWDLDGDGEFDDGTGAQATHAFAAPGDHRVAVRLTDDEGASSVAEGVVTVASPPSDPGPGTGTGGSTDPGTGAETPAGGTTETPASGQTQRPVTSPPVTPEPSAPKARVATRTVRVNRRGIALVRVACAAPDGSRCVTRVVLERPRRGERAVRLGKRRTSIDAGKTRVVKVRLSRSAVALLRERRRLAARAVVTTAGSDRPLRTSRRVVLRRSR